MKQHPLINRVDSSHYDTEDGTSLIEEVEKTYTIREVLGFVTINLDKYHHRLGLKDDVDREFRKIDSYKNYHIELIKLLDKVRDDKMIVKDGWKQIGVEWKY